MAENVKIRPKMDIFKVIYIYNCQKSITNIENYESKCSAKWD